MLRQYQNNGNFSSGTISVNATDKFFNGKLVAQLQPMFTRYSTTGEYAQKLNDFQCRAQITGYFGDFNLLGWYSTPTKKLNQDTGSKAHVPACYQLQLGFSKGAWQASATAYNFFRSSWESSQESLTGQYYELDCRTYDTTQHMRFQLSVTYTFSYGKKVQRNNELSGVGTAASAILK